MKALDTLDALQDRWHPRNRERIYGMMCYLLTDAPEGDCSSIWVDFGQTGQSEVTVGEGLREADLTLTLSHADYMAMMRGEVDSKQLFAEKRLLVGGSAKMAAVMYRANVAARTKLTYRPVSS